MLEDFIHFVQKENLFQADQKILITVSGGIDSAVTSTLCALTNKPTIVVSMPIHQAPTQLQRAHDHIKWLKMNFPNILSLSTLVK